MKLSESQASFIKDAFKKLETQEDLLSLLNYSKVLIYGEATRLFTLRQLTYHTSPTFNKQRYRSFFISKKSGAPRQIMTPNKGLKEILQALNIILQAIYTPPPHVTGFVADRSVVDNARFHVGQQYVYCLDIKDFFTSINQPRIWGRLQAKPFELNEATGRLPLANMIASLCCAEMMVDRTDETGATYRTLRSVLPQGAPTSPVMSNIICQQLDYYLTTTAKRFGVKYSRYADDITFSSMRNVYQSSGSFLREISKIISAQNFSLNIAKTRLQRPAYKQVVTGLTVNEQVNVSKSYIKKIRQYLYLWETYGYDRANFYCNKNHRPFANERPVSLREVLIGQLNFFKMVKGAQNNTFLTLALRLSKLTKYAYRKNYGKDREIIELKRELEKVKRSQQHEIALEISKRPPLTHDPRFVLSLLNKFTESTILKYSTHFWDREAERQVVKRDTFFTDLKDDIYKRYPFAKLEQINADLYWKILNFTVVKSDLGWGNHHLKIGWHNPELIDYYTVNRDKQPTEFQVPAALLPKRPVEGKTLQYFEDFVDVFKNEIEFRGNNFYFLIKGLCDTHLGYDYNVTIEGLKGMNFYTDTQKIADAIEIIILNLKGSERSIYPIVAINGYYDSVKNTFKVTIEHVGSFCHKHLTDDKLMLKNKGQLLTIRNKLISLCDWSIISVFRVDNQYEPRCLTYLSVDRLSFEEKEPYVVSNAPKARGFMHEFIFYL